MIEKIKWNEQPEDAAKEVQNLIDQLVDAANRHEQKLKILIDGLEKWAQSQQDKETTIVFEQRR